MKPIKITYDKKGNTLYVRFNDKKEAYCRESDVGNKEVIYSIADDGSLIGFEIINYIAKGKRRPATILPIETEIVKAS